jgi:hypothetical protein
VNEEMVTWHAFARRFVCKVGMLTCCALTHISVAYDGHQMPFEL